MPHDTLPVIGLITGSNFSTPQEFAYRFAGQAKVITNYIEPRKFSYDDLDYAVSKIPEAAAELMKQHPSILAFSSMSITCLRGDDIINQLEQRFGIPVLVTATATVDALRLANAKRIMILSPFGAAINLVERYFFERNGIEVIRVANLFDPKSEELFNPTDVNKIQIREYLSRPYSDVDAILLDSPTLLTPIDLPRMEAIAGVPIISANQALADAIARKFDFSQYQYQRQ